jgi:hypothetical protein
MQRMAGKSDCAALRQVKAMNITVQTRSIKEIRPNLRNARTHSAKQIRQIANSIVAFGFTNPLLVSEHGELIAGHGQGRPAARSRKGAGHRNSGALACAAARPCHSRQ